VTDLDSSTEVYFGLGLSESHLGAPSEVYLGLVTDLDSSTEVYLGLVETDFPPTEVYFDLGLSEAHLGAPSEVYLGLVETDLPLNDVYFGLYIVDSVRGSLGYPNSVVSHSALWILTWPFN
jgi:hypothetical protein